MSGAIHVRFVIWVDFMMEAVSFCLTADRKGNGSESSCPRMLTIGVYIIPTLDIVDCTSRAIPLITFASTLAH